MSRQSYEGVAVAVPVSIPYQRYSTSNAHWFIGQALQELVKKSGIAKGEIDGLTISSFSFLEQIEHLRFGPELYFSSQHFS